MEKYRATVIIELYRVRCPQCGVRSRGYRNCRAKRPLAKTLRMPWGWHAKALRYARWPDNSDWPLARCERSTYGICSAGVPHRRQAALEQMGVDEIYFGKQMKFITVVSNLETGEPLWFGQDRKQETLDEFFRTQLTESQRKRYRGGLRGYVAAVHQQHCPLGWELPPCVRQVSRPPTRQSGHR